MEIKLVCFTCGGDLEDTHPFRVRPCEKCQTQRNLNHARSLRDAEERFNDRLEEIRLLKREISDLKGRLVAEHGIVEAYRLEYQEPLIWGIVEAVEKHGGMKNNS